MAWVDRYTGELVEEGALNCIEVELEVASEDGQEPDYEWLADWYLRKLALIKAEQDLLNAQHQKRMQTLLAAERSLELRWKDRFEDVVMHDMAAQKGKKKSVAYAYGTGGLRTTKKTVVTDEDAALEWAEEHCEGAVKVTVSLLKSALPKDKVVPGIERKSETTFYAKPSKP